MFNEEELKFIGETACKDLNSIDQKIRQIIDEIARYGKQLADLRVTQLKLQSISQAVKDSVEEDDNEPGRQSRCC